MPRKTAPKPVSKKRRSVAAKRSSEETALAIQQLSKADHAKLRRYADWKFFGTRGTLKGSSSEDLVNEAIALTLGGKRPWRVKVDIKTHLQGCMQSIVSGWYKTAARDKELTDTHPGQGNPEAEIAAHQAICTLQSRFKNVMERKILELLLDGWSAAEVKERLNINDDVYLAAKKNIYRGVRKLMESSKGKADA